MQLTSLQNVHVKYSQSSNGCTTKHLGITQSKVQLATLQGVWLLHWQNSAGIIMTHLDISRSKYSWHLYKVWQSEYITQLRTKEIITVDGHKRIWICWDWRKEKMIPDNWTDIMTVLPEESRSTSAAKLNNQDRKSTHSLLNGCML